VIYIVAEDRTIPPWLREKRCPNCGSKQHRGCPREWINGRLVEANGDYAEEEVVRELFPEGPPVAPAHVDKIRAPINTWPPEKIDKLVR